jgi:hypothetical protein
MKKVCFMVLCVSLLSFGCSAADEPQTEFKALSTTQDVMAGLMDPAAQIIWNSVSTTIDKDGVHDNRPQTKEEWQKVGYAARGLAESASLLLYDGRLEDHGDWEKWTKELAATAMEAAKAADDQDAEAVITTGGNIYEVCTNCHMGYLERVEMKRTGGQAPAPGTSNAPGATPAPAPETK